MGRNLGDMSEKKKVKVYGHIMHYRPSEVFILEMPDEYYKEEFERQIKNTNILIDNVIKSEE